MIASGFCSSVVRPELTGQGGFLDVVSVSKVIT